MIWIMINDPYSVQVQCCPADEFDYIRRMSLYVGLKYEKTQ